MGGLAALLLVGMKIRAAIRTSKTESTQAMQKLESSEYLVFIDKHIQGWWSIIYYSIGGALFVMLVGPMAAHPIHADTEFKQNAVIVLTFVFVGAFIGVICFCQKQVAKDYERKTKCLTSRQSQRA